MQSSRPAYGGRLTSPVRQREIIPTEVSPMKKAVIVVGPHFSGKSKTIKKYFKPLVGLSGNQRTFDLNEKPGIVLSQSLEEKRLGRVLSQSIEEKGTADVEEFLSRYLFCQWLVLAARPLTEHGSHCIDPLNSCTGVIVEGNDDEYPDGRRYQTLDGQA